MPLPTELSERMRSFQFALLAALALVTFACAPASDPPPDQLAAAGVAPASFRPIDRSPAGFNADLITAAGIHVKTNGQYKTAAQRNAAGAAIDRYWHEVQKCAKSIVPPGYTIITNQLMPEFPSHLSVEIANDWKVVAGPTTHHKTQAFPSHARPGTWSTARHQEDAIYIEVVPELNGLAPQMAAELNLWLARNSSMLAADLSNTCASLACFRFRYNNSPSEAWKDCLD